MSTSHVKRPDCREFVELDISKKHLSRYQSYCQCEECRQRKCQKIHILILPEYPYARELTE